MKKFLMTLVIGMLGVTALGFSCGGGSPPAPTCNIFGGTYNEGDRDPDVSFANHLCYSCQTGKTTNAWSPVADGTTNCDPSDNTKACKGGACTNETDGQYCNISGQLYPAGLNANNACQYCNPAPVNLGGAPYNWSLQPSGAPCHYVLQPDGTLQADTSRCDSSGHCQGNVVTQCHIANASGSVQTFNPGDTNPASPQCQKCDLTTHISQYPDGGVINANGGEFSWTNFNDQGACTARDRNGNVITHNGGTATGHCNGGFCDIYCTLNNQKWESENQPTPPGVTPDLSGGAHHINYLTGANPADSCQYCDAFKSGNTWSGENDVRVCNSTSVSKGVCHTGSCALGCGISGAYYTVGAVTENGCRWCATSGDQAWTFKPDNSVCPTAAHSFCEQSGRCLSGCVIGGTFYNDGTVNPGNSCQTCSAATSTSGWTNKATNSTCPSGFCSGSTCTQGCLVGSTITSTGTLNPTNSCQVCNAGQIGYSNQTNGASCTKSAGGAGTCSNGSCN
jgi:hypothetical protein